MFASGPGVAVTLAVVLLALVAVLLSPPGRRGVAAALGAVGRWPGLIRAELRGHGPLRAEDHRPEDHRAENHRAENHRAENHRAEDHRAENHRAEDHRAENHRAEDHGAGDHRPGDRSDTTPDIPAVPGGVDETLPPTRGLPEVGRTR